MSNMSYCRFENTSVDLDDCYNALEEMYGEEDFEKLSDYERFAAIRLINTCKDIVRIGEEMGVI